MAIIVLLIALAIFVLCFAYYSYRISFYAPKPHNEDIYAVPDGEQYEKLGQKMVEISLIMESAACELVSIDGFASTHLEGRLYAYTPGTPIFLAFHGYRSMALRDCAGAFALSQKLGFNILAVDQRSHGGSDGNAITFGIRERYDCLKWIEYINLRFGPDTPIILSGISMGAATVLMASELNLPDNVLCIMADCPYDSPSGIICKVATDRGYPEKLTYPIVVLGAKLFGGLNLLESSASEAVKHAKIPILLIHGEDDRFVPCDMSRRIYKNCTSPAQLHTFPNAGHGLCYILNPRHYEKICVDFLWTIPELIPHLQKSEFSMTIHNA